VSVELDVKPRENVPAWLTYGTPVFTVVAALAVGAIALIALNVDPIAAYTVMFVNTLTTEFGLRETVIKTVPLILTALAVYLPLKAGLWNIGAEGQLLFGALAGTWVATNIALPWFGLIPLMFVASAVAGAFWAGVPAWLRARYGVNEIITSLLLVFVAANLKNYLLRGPMQDPTGNFPQSALFSEAATIPGLFGTGVHAGLLVALAMVGLTYVFMRKTRLGFSVTLVGDNDEAAEQAGISKYWVYILVFLIAGILAGLAGISEIAGVQGRYRASFNPGYGFTAIVIALLGRNGAFKVLLAAAFFALIFVGGSSLEVALGVPAALVEVLQALIILFLITAEFFKSYRVGIDYGREPSGGPSQPVGGDD